VEVHSRESDEQRARRAATEPSAFAELYHRYVVRVHRYCSRRLADEALAEDATSQVFLKALEGLRRGRIDNVTSWTFAIAHNEVVDRYRRQRIDHSFDELDAFESADPGPEDAVIAHLEATELRSLLPRLSHDQQRVIELRLAGLDTREIHDVLGKSKSWVGVTQYRALHQLRKLLEASAGGKEGQR
jgi:RNA polymerase sigma-70 factor (ECF subfamily)